jgi:hypothetical protein
MNLQNEISKIPIVIDGRNLRIGSDEDNKSVDMLFDLFKNITVEFTKYVIDLKDSNIDSIDYHYYLNSTIEEMFIKFLYLKQCNEKTQ